LGGALHALLAEVSGDVGSEIMRAWLEYEYETTPEGRYVMALDVLLPVFMNFVAGPDSSWSRFGITAGDVRRRVNHVRSVTPALADLALRVIDEAAERGLLREGGSA
jgi:putative hydrolase of HD superfamily